MCVLRLNGATGCERADTDENGWKRMLENIRQANTRAQEFFFPPLKIIEVKKNDLLS